MGDKRKTLGLILVLAFLVIAYFGYRALTNGGNPLPKELTQQESATKQGQEILAELGKLKRIELDGSLFSNPVFLSLEDFTVDVNDQPKGRPNPFAPIGTNNSAKLNDITSNASDSGTETTIEGGASEEGTSTNSTSTSETSGRGTPAAGLQTSVQTGATSSSPATSGGGDTSSPPNSGTSNVSGGASAGASASENGGAESAGPPPPPAAPSM